MRIRSSFCPKQPLSLRVAFDEIDQFFAAAGLPQVAERLSVHGEESHSGTIFGSHVGKSGPIGQRHLGEPGAKEFYKLADDPMFPQHLGHGQHQVGGSRPLRQLSI